MLPILSEPPHCLVMSSQHVSPTSDSGPIRHVYKVVNGTEIDVDIYLPKRCVGSSESAPCPVVINIHGGAFMLGSSRMVNRDQVQDCLDRNWVVLAPNHRLCPQVDLLEGPIADCRDLLTWVYRGDLQDLIKDGLQMPHKLDMDHVFAFGTSSGGTLALSLGFQVPRPVAGILDMYGPSGFSDPFWTSKLPALAAKLPPDLSQEFMNKVFSESPIPVTGGVSLEGQQQAGPDFGDPRQAYALTHLANGKVMDAIFPSKDWGQVDPAENITSRFPPTFIVHGIDDELVPIGLSRVLYSKLQQYGVKCGMREIPNEGHTFAARMEKGSTTWNMQRGGFDFLKTLL